MIANALPIAAEHIERELLKSKRMIEQGEHWDGLMAADEAIKLDPLSDKALFLSGMALFRGGCPGAACVLLNAAAKIEPRHETWNNIGCCLNELHPKEAYAAFMQAHKLKPDDVGTLSNLASICCNLGRHEESIAWAAQALKLQPNNTDVVYNMALGKLARGRWAEGWAHYSVSMPNKFRQERFFDEAHKLPRWDGSEGHTVVVYGEQGLGDEVLFASMVDKALASGSRIVIETDKRLEHLWRRSFPGAKVYGTRWDTYCEWPVDEQPTAKLEIGGLGELYAPEPFRRGAYLTADPEKRVMARAWLDRVCQPDSLKVGIAWTAGSWRTGRAVRSVPTEQLLPIISAPGVEFVCLEYEDPADGLRRLEPHRVEHSMQPIHDLRTFVKRGCDYDDTAALVAELDLVIAPTTSIVDLAGSLGVPVWVLVDARPQWRYGAAAGDDRMFVYESARTYRQKIEGEWGVPVAGIAKDLRALAGARKAAA